MIECYQMKCRRCGTTSPNKPIIPTVSTQWDEKYGSMGVWESAHFQNSITPPLHHSVLEGESTCSCTCARR